MRFICYDKPDRLHFSPYRLAKNAAYDYDWYVTCTKLGFKHTFEFQDSNATSDAAFGALVERTENIQRETGREFPWVMFYSRSPVEGRLSVFARTEDELLWLKLIL